MTQKLLFVCLGNICRSPAAEGVFLHLLEERGLSDQFVVDSAGTGGWHVGNPAVAAVATQGLIQLGRDTIPILLVSGRCCRCRRKTVSGSSVVEALEGCQSPQLHHPDTFRIGCELVQCGPALFGEVR